MKIFPAVLAILALLSVCAVHAGESPLYVALTGSSSKAPGPITWNFNKFLIGRDGAIISRFDSEVEPGLETLTKAVESALRAK